MNPQERPSSPEQGDEDAFRGLNAPAGSLAGDVRAQGPVTSATGSEAGAVSGTRLLDGARDGEDIAAAIADHLSYLEELCDVLGATNTVATCFTPLLGRWSELESEAERWREAAAAVADASQGADAQLGRLDGAWEGKDADAFVAYIRRVVVAGSEVQESIGVFASALDETAIGVRRIALDMAEVLVDTAETVSESAAMAADGADRARLQLEETDRHIRALSDTAEDVLQDFAQLCTAVSEDGDDGARSRDARMERRYPDERFRFTDAAPEATDSSGNAAEAASGDDSSIGGGAAAAQVGGVGGGEPDPADGESQRRSASEGATEFGAGAVTGTAVGAVAGGAARAAGAPMMGGMMPMGAMGAASGQGGDKEHRAKQRTVTEPNELFGRPEPVAPPVIGEEKPK